MKNESYNEIKKYYDDYSSWYHGERHQTFYYSFINEIETDLVKQFVVDKKTLEIGSGTGIILEEISKVSQESWGIDLSQGMVDTASSRGLNVRQANATEIPFPDKTFDVIYSFKVLAHIPEIEKVIEEVHRVLKDDGVAILEFYNPYSLKYLTNRLAKSPEKVYTRYDSLNDIRQYYEGRFEVIKTTGARIITPFAQILRIPLLNKLIVSVEKMLSKTPASRLSGYFIVVARKPLENKAA